MNGELHISMLGSFVVRGGGETAVFRTDALRVLLAYLAAHQGRPQRRDTLAGLLSPDRPDKEALTYLRNRLTRLRKAIGDETAVPPYLDIDRKQIALRMGDDIQIDLIQFEQNLKIVETHPHRQLAGCPTCLARLDEAVRLVRGEFLAGLNFSSDTWEAWLINQREHVQTRALEAMTWLREAKMVLGEFTAVVDIAQQQLAFEPWHEAAHRALITAHAALGDRNAALAQYEQCQQILWDELGVEPEEETVELVERMKAEGRGQNLSFIPQSAAFPNNLPAQTTRFFGREAEQAQLLERLVDPNYRLVTLVGTGGIGKTRLSLQVAEQVKTSFPDGVWFIPLAAVRGDAEQIKIAIGEVLGLGQADKQLTGEQVLAILRDKQLLLVFDNSEPVLDALVFIPEWLRRAPDIAILATSREPLNFQMESVLLLDGLPIGDETASAAEALFGERAQMARSDFELTSNALLDVRRICQLVDGSPLGISLAAAWVRRRSLRQIIDSIEQSLDFLSTRLRDIDPRHRSMRAVFETSWALLESEEQDILAALSVFPTTFSGKAAAGVAGATLFDLDVLCEKSLLMQQQADERYLLHGLVRQYAREKLGGGETAVFQTFTHYFQQFATAHQTDYAALQPEWQNLSAAVATAHQLAQWQQLLNLVQTLNVPWFRQIRFHEMRTGLQLAAEAATALGDDEAFAQTLLRLGEIEMELNDYAAAEAHLTEATEQLMRLEDSLGIAQGYFLNGRIKSEQGKDEEAEHLFAKAKDIYTDEEVNLGIAKCLNMMAVFQFKQSGRFQKAEQYLQQSAQLQRESPLTSTYVETLRYLARIQSINQTYESAEELLFEAAKVSQQLNDIGEHAAVLFEQLALNKKQQRYDKALLFGQKSLEKFKKIGSIRWEGLIKTQLGLLHQAKREPRQGLSYLIESLLIFEEVGDVFEQAYSHYYLYKLYELLGETERSLRAKENARTLNLQLKNPRLAERLK